MEGGTLDLTCESSRRIKNASLLAILLVVLIHSPKFFPLLQCRFAAGAVPLFFAISGFLIAGHLSEAGYWCREVGKRIRTLLVPYLLICALAFVEFVVLRLIWNFAHGAAWSYQMDFNVFYWLGLDFTRSPAHVSLWFLRTLMGYVIALPLIALGCKLRWWWLVVVWGMSVGEHFVSEIDLSVIKIVKTIVNPSALFFFSLGILLRTCNCKFLENKTILPICGVAFLVGTIVFLLCPVVPFYMRVPECLCYAGVVWILAGSREMPQWLVGNTFAIYLFHNLILSPLGSPIGGGWFGGCLCFGIAVAGSLVVAVCVRLFFPRIGWVVLGGR